MLNDLKVLLLPFALLSAASLLAAASPLTFLHTVYMRLVTLSKKIRTFPQNVELFLYRP